MTNEALRSHVTNIGFSLTLSKNMIETVVLMHHFGGFNRFHAAVKDIHPGRAYISSAHALIRRGLFRDQYAAGEACDLCKVQYCDHKLTRAGVSVADLLRESGIYDEVLDRYDFTQKADAA